MSRSCRTNILIVQPTTRFSTGKPVVTAQSPRTEGPTSTGGQEAPRAAPAIFPLPGRPSAQSALRQPLPGSTTSHLSSGHRHWSGRPTLQSPASRVPVPQPPARRVHMWAGEQRPSGRGGPLTHPAPATAGRLPLREGGKPVPGRGLRAELPLDAAGGGQRCVRPGRSVPIGTFHASGHSTSPSGLSEEEAPKCEPAPVLRDPTR